MEEAIKKILAVAVTAPSGDNSQPWWFHIEGDSLEVHMYPTKDNRILNFKLSGTHIAMGALIENITILAQNEGMDSSVALFPDTTNFDFVAKIDFTQKNMSKDSLAPAIPLRCTNRKPYKGTQIDPDILTEIAQSGDMIKPNHVRFITDKKSIKELADASSTMERVALETESIHKLFFESIVWSEEEERAKGMGLPIKTTELPPPIQLLFRAIRHWNIAKTLNYIGLSFLASKANAQTYATGAAIGIVVADEFDKFAYVHAGRIFQRVWLSATTHGLAFQPVTGILFLGQRVLANETEVFHKKHIPLIKRSYATITRLFTLEKGVPAMLFRIGYAGEPTAKTQRRGAEIR